MGDAVRRLAGVQFRGPKTLLGFFAIVFGILVTGAAMFVRALVAEPKVHFLILPIVMFVGIVVVLILGGVFFTAWKDPTILMLGEVSGSLFIENRRLSLGDSNHGEKIETVSVPTAEQRTNLLPGGDMTADQNDA